MTRNFFKKNTELEFMFNTSIRFVMKGAKCVKKTYFVENKMLNFATH